jgi:hypothetical protein
VIVDVIKDREFVVQLMTTRYLYIDREFPGALALLPPKRPSEVEEKNVGPVATLPADAQTIIQVFQEQQQQMKQLIDTNARLQQRLMSNRSDIDSVTESDISACMQKSRVGNRHVDKHCLGAACGGRKLTGQNWSKHIKTVH